MLDTIRVVSPEISEETAQAVEKQLQTALRYDHPTGEVLYEFTSGHLEGSWDSRICVRIEREEWKRRKPMEVPGSHILREFERLKMPCEPKLVFEGSVHKALMGHNVIGGPERFRPVARWFIAEVGERLGVCLPEADTWEVRRIDWSEVFRLPADAIEEYLIALRHAKYPRRKPINYRGTAFFPGTTTALRFYHKGPEFRKHDFKRVQGHSADTADELHQLASELLRVEVEIKAKKLREDLGPKVPVSDIVGDYIIGPKVLVSDITDDYIMDTYWSEVVKVTREVEGGSKTRDQVEVDRPLQKAFGGVLAGNLFSFWIRMCALGEQEVRASMKIATFYKYRKALTEQGCSWLGADLEHRESPIPSDFKLTKDSAYLVRGESQLVYELLYPFRQSVRRT